MSNLISLPQLEAAEIGSSQGDILWDRIVSIDYIGYEHVYDIEVEGTHNFIGNGIFAHNTYIKDGTQIEKPEERHKAAAGGLRNIIEGITGAMDNYAARIAPAIILLIFLDPDVVIWSAFLIAGSLFVSENKQEDKISLADYLRTKFNWSDEDIGRFAEERIGFIRKLRGLFSEVSRGGHGVEPFFDSSRYIITPRDQKRWANEMVRYFEEGGEELYEAIYLGALSNYFLNIELSQLYDAETKETLLHKVCELFKEEFGKYYSGKDIDKRMDFPLGGEGHIRAMVRHNFWNGINSLFLKDPNGGEIIDRILEEECTANGYEFIYVPIGPYTDRSQILGMKAPSEMIGFEEAKGYVDKTGETQIKKALADLLDLPDTEARDVYYKEYLGYKDKNPQMIRIIGTYLKSLEEGKGIRKGQGIRLIAGVLTRAIEYAQKNPDKKVKMYLDNIDGAPAKVRNGIFNHLLEKGEIEVPGYGRLRLPKNLQLIFSAGKLSEIKDKALFNRLQKYAVPGLTIDDMLEICQKEYGYSDEIKKAVGEIFKEFIAKYLDIDSGIEIYSTIIKRLFERIDGISKDRGDTEWNLRIVLREIEVMLLGMIPDKDRRGQFREHLYKTDLTRSDKYRNNEKRVAKKELEPYYFDSKKGELYFMDVPVGLSIEIKEALRDAGENWEYELYKKTGVILHSKSVDMYIGIIRNIRYNNRIIQVIGSCLCGAPHKGCNVETLFMCSNSY